ncbi:HTH domain-containing protein [Neptunomonas sp. XY-337]|uniref:HTH domain-containing protein n=1 Tax=Neptunomonas sp. XY-337 TaxID=2561897 RepID=UPI0010AA9F51|nr:HTH domain-containing protein [Neptunomonas sp. XY-337]
MTWKEAIIEILRQNNAAMHYLDITEKIVEQHLVSFSGKTPHNTVSNTLTTTIKKFGSESPFVYFGDAIYGLNGSSNEILNNDESTEQKFVEGSQKTVYVNRYERNAKARKECLEHYGHKCWVCGFDFEQTYGKDIGKGFIHVHHIVELASIGSEYEVNPITDLIPLCPNCHAMVHRKVPAMSPQELKKKLT